MKKFVPLIILFGCAAVFLFGVAELFQLRFEKGDVYPAYSSLRTDPLGSMAFYESLEKMPGLKVARDFSYLNRLPETPNTVYLHLAGEQYEWQYLSDDLYRDLEGFLGRGGRLVITFYPRTAQFTYSDEEDNSETNTVTPPKEKKNSGKKNPIHPSKKKSKDEEEEFEVVSLQDKWHFYPVFQKLENDGENYEPARVTNCTSLALPPVLWWHSGLVFSNTDNSWQVIYRRGTNAVMMQRQFGRGSVVLASDSYFVSNEAMVKDRHADLLAFLIGSQTNVYFDEAHFGIMDTSGVAALMRKYRLHGLAAGLLLLAGLLIWKNATSLVPPLEDERPDHTIAGKESAAGFVNLLRRSITPQNLPATCFDEWKKAMAAKGSLPPSRRQQAEAIFAEESARPARERNPVSAYRKISDALGKHHSP